MADDYGINPTKMTMEEGRDMPQDLEAESSVLSAMMISAEALQECLIGLTPDDFFHPSNRIVFMAMREMFDKNLPIDAISLADQLRTQGELDRIGGRSSATTRWPSLVGAATSRCSTATPPCAR